MVCETTRAFHSPTWIIRFDVINCRCPVGNIVFVPALCCH